MTLAIVGAGAMGEALLGGWIGSGIDPAEVLVVDASAARVAQVTARYGVRGVDLAEAAEAEVLVLAVKPYQMPAVLQELSGSIGASTLVVSIAAGVTLAVLEAALPDASVIRVMPNTPALVRKGMAGVMAGSKATPEQVDAVSALMEALGRSVVIPEDQVHALTALSGSGPAYLFYVAEAMIEAGVHQGLSRGAATELVNQTFVGAGAMLSESGHSATELREMVTSPAGTTAAALRALDDHGVRSGILAAVEACTLRSQEMSGL